MARGLVPSLGARTAKTVQGNRIESLPTRGYARTMTSIVVADDHGIVRRACGACSRPSPIGRSAARRSTAGRSSKRSPVRSPTSSSSTSRCRDSAASRPSNVSARSTPDTKVILLSVHSDPPFIQSAIALGADGYVLKNGPSAEIVTAIQAVTRGGSYFSPAVAREIVEQLRTPRAEGDDPFSLLSVREREVLHRIADGSPPRRSRWSSTSARRPSRRTARA